MTNIHDDDVRIVLEALLGARMWEQALMKDARTESFRELCQNRINNYTDVIFRLTRALKGVD